MKKKSLLLILVFALFFGFCSVNLAAKNHADASVDYETVQAIDEEKQVYFQIALAKSEAVYTVVYDANGGSGAMDESHFTVGETYELSPNAFYREGYTFLGWSTSSLFLRVKYQDEASVSNLSKRDHDTVKLYAVWQKNTYTISFDANGGNGSMNDLLCVYQKRVRLTRNAFKRDGYRFVGWSTDPNASMGEYADRQSLNSLTSEANAEIRLYAIWSVNSYTIRFLSKTGWGATSVEQSCIYGETVVLKNNTFEKYGYTFVGWSFDKSSNVVFEDGQEVLNVATQGRVFLYAVWKENAYFIRFDANGGDGEMSLQQCKYGQRETLDQNTLVRNGYSFVGWSNKANDYRARYVDQGTIASLTAEADGTAVLYAIWKPNVYTIEYDANGANGSMWSQRVNFGQSVKLRAQAFRKPNHTFLGWSRDPDATNVEFLNKESVSDLVESGTITLYAVWGQNQYTIRFDANGGSGTMPMVLLDCGATVTLPTNEFQREGYLFLGWAKNKSARKATYQDAQQINSLTNVRDGVVSLYAVWSVKEYTIQYNANGGSGFMFGQYVLYGNDATLRRNNYSRPMFTFLGWSRNADAVTPEFLDGEIVRDLAESGTVTLYAVWESSKYTICYEANGGSGTMQNTVAECAALATLSPNTFTRQGYHFIGWSKNDRATNVDYTDAEQIGSLSSVANKQISLYAVWEPNEYVVRFNANGGTGSMNDQAFVYDREANLSTCEFEKTGFEFAGWASFAVSSDVSYTNGQKVKNLSEQGTIELYAIWEKVRYTVEFNANGGTGSMSNITFEYGQTITLHKNTFSRDGYRFMGWSTDPSAVSATYQDHATVGDLYGKGKTITLYAVWQGNENLIYFDANGGTGTMDPLLFKFGSSVVLSLNQFKRTNCDFVGWSLDKKAKEPTYLDGESVSDLVKQDRSVILYAVWKGKSITISFDPAGGTGTMVPQKYEYGQNDKLSMNEFVRAGYVFVGWSRARDDLSRMILNCGRARLAGTEREICLYAVWEKRSDGEQDKSKYTYLVSDETELLSVMLMEGANAILVEDIIMMEKWDGIPAFQGVLDGEGHSIVGLTNRFIGTNYGTLRNVVFEEIMIKASLETSGNGRLSGSHGGRVRYHDMSGICWRNEGKISSCTILNSSFNVLITEKENSLEGSVAGFCIYNTGLIEKCSIQSSEIVAMFENRREDVVDTPNVIFEGVVAGITTINEGVVRNCTYIDTNIRGSAYQMSQNIFSWGSKQEYVDGYYYCDPFGFNGAEDAEMVGNQIVSGSMSFDVIQYDWSNEYNLLNPLTKRRVYNDPDYWNNKWRINGEKKMISIQYGQ